MRGVASTLSGYFALALVLAALQLHPLALAALPPAVAVAWAEQRRPAAWALVGLAGLAGLVGTASPATGLIYLLMASLGVLLGLGFLRGWSYTRCVALLAGSAFLGAAASAAAQWSALRQASRAWMSGQMSSIEKAGQEDNTAATTLVEASQWFSNHWDSLALGFLFGGMLLFSCVAVSVATAWLRRRGTRVLAQREGVGTFRPGDWLVWAVITAAVLWMIDNQWPQDVLRMLSWNAAVGLAFVYWLNGFACLIFAMNTLRVHPLMYVTVIFLVLMLSVHSLLCLFGLFDTWLDFRLKTLKAVEARRLRESSDDHEL